MHQLTPRTLLVHNLLPNPSIYMGQEDTHFSLCNTYFVALNLSCIVGRGKNVLLFVCSPTRHPLLSPCMGAYGAINGCIFQCVYVSACMRKENDSYNLCQAPYFFYCRRCCQMMLSFSHANNYVMAFIICTELHLQ